MTATYSGHVTPSGTNRVTVTDRAGTRRLPMCLNIANHSPTGFAWGYGGSREMSTSDHVSHR